jgi:hypothetical protein
MGQFLHGSATTTSSRRFGPARKTLPVYRQDIFDERI